MPRAKWGAGDSPLTIDDITPAERVQFRAERSYMRSANKPVYLPQPDIDAQLEPGQFTLRYNKGGCPDCGEFMHKGDVAGYDSEDEIVCEDCWTPYNER